MVYAAIDIHKHSFQAAVLDPESGEVVEERFSADRDSLARWAEPWRRRVAAVAIDRRAPLWNEPSLASPTRQPAPQTSRAKIGMGSSRPPQASRPPPRLATPTILR